MTYTVAALYKFFDIEDAAAFRQTIKEAFLPLTDLCGSLLVAPEGINGTLAASASTIEAMLSILARHAGLERDEVKFSTAQEKPFNRLKIRLKKEIVTFNQPHIDPLGGVGTYVEPKDWNRLIAQDDVVVLDTRNIYETRIGTFERAVVPPISIFTQFADFVRQNLDPSKHKKIAMFCTGGIRCEKASAFMRAEGFEEVYHLKGGILKYIEDIEPRESRWLGDCYVFDKRMAVGHGLRSGHYAMCYHCGNALSEAEQGHPHYEAGVSCQHCFEDTDEKAKDRLRARHRQMTSKGPLPAQENQAEMP